MGDGTRENPYIRDDVERLIEENGGKAEGLDLSGQFFRKGIDLCNLDLSGIILNDAYFFNGFVEDKFISANLEGALLNKAMLQKAQLSSANFKGADLTSANLEMAHLYSCNFNGANLCFSNMKDVDLDSADFIEADLDNANLEGATLEGANFTMAYLGLANFHEANLDSVIFTRADLENANLKMASLFGTDFNGANLLFVEFSNDTELDNVQWGNYILGEEMKGEEKKGQERIIWFALAADTYRNLKTWYTEHGIYDVAGKFFYREMEAKRKAQSWREKPFLKLWYWIMRILAGYGENPERVAITAAAVILGAALVYYFIGLLFDWSAFGRSLYFSTVSFTALGYGSWIDVESNVIRGLGAVESFLGVFMMALFLVTFTRKMTR